ncbi:hypothetical protein SAMN05192562_102440 [Kosakonia arachidis]|uniref:Uncharacterized protein n=2 Tax=Kosakonia arachidis TaxID=551989 RepID=A0A1I7BBI4_9ENTR|nr:hypothetical protein SAMN05192562_102440 [Kosakonia arachidis]
MMTPFEFDDQMVSRDAIVDRLRKYGFIEIATLNHFLYFFCGIVPDRASYLYIKEKLQECLDIHNNGSDYFLEIHRLVQDIDYAMSI